MGNPYDAVARFARETPDALAYVSGANRMTFADLDRSVRGIARLLRQRGVEPGDRVALDLPAELEPLFAYALFHEAAVGCRLEPSVSPDWFVSTSAGQIVVDGAWLADAATGAIIEPRAFASGEALCRILFSSGTTGTPKPVPFTLDQLWERVRSARELWMGLPPFLNLIGVGTATGFLTLVATMSDGRPYLQPSSAAANLALVREFGVRTVKGSPSQLAELLSVTGQPTPATVRRIHSAGSPIPAALAERLAAHFGARVLNLYGSTEAGTAVIHEDATAALDTGAVIADVELQIVDDDGAPVPEGQIGAVRYRRAGDFFYPGDLGSLSGARLTLHGRSAELINAAGVKVDPARLDQAALALDGIVDAAGFATTTQHGLVGIGLAFVSEGDPDIRAISVALREQLGTAAPTVLVRVERIPRTASGKAMRIDLTMAYGSVH